MLETNLDDVSGEVIGHCIAQLWDAGALDVYTTAIQMKKNRPGVKLSILCGAEKVAAMETIVFRETGTLGIRRWPTARHVLPREIRQVATAWGPVEGKLGSIGRRLGPFRAGVRIVPPYRRGDARCRCARCTPPPNGPSLANQPMAKLRQAMNPATGVSTSMKRILPALLVLSALAGGCDFKLGPLPPVEVYFSPKGGATEAVVRALDSAQQTVFVQAYSFTSKDIAEALLRARRRGVVIHIILDKSNLSDHYSGADFVANSGMSVLIDAKHPIAHNKIMIIDGETVITGSFNFTRQAEEHNAENLLVIHDRGLAERVPGQLARSRSP